MKTLRRLVLVTLPLGLLLALVIGTVFWAFSGRVEVSALESHSPLVERLLTAVRERAIERGVRGQRERLRVRGDRVNESGAGSHPMAALRLYAEHCQMCHGGPGVGPDAVGLGLNPVPPALDSKGRETSIDRDAWIIANGLRMTGMPAYEISLTDGQIWGLANWTSGSLSLMTAEEYASLTGSSVEVRTREARSPEPPPPAADDR